MWKYEQSTGKLTHNALYVITGYSGNGIYKNNPRYQNLMNQGPIPVGDYTIEEPRNDNITGAYSLPLIPSTFNDMFHRGSFLIHGENMFSPGNASHGCIILPRTIREQIWESNDHQLQVW